jgi:DNA-binding NtrC family response regulator
LLVDHYVAFYSKKYGKPSRRLPPDVAVALEAYHWPGNVRALRHAASDAVILAGDDAFTVEDFSLSRAAPARMTARRPDRFTGEATSIWIAPRKRWLRQALKKHSYNISLAAAELGPDARQPLSPDGQAWALTRLTESELSPEFPVRPRLAGGPAAS